MRKSEQKMYDHDDELVKLHNKIEFMKIALEEKAKKPNNYEAELLRIEKEGEEKMHEMRLKVKELENRIVMQGREHEQALKI